MSSTYDNTVFDFDLDFLNQPSTNNAVGILGYDELYFEVGSSVHKSF